MSAISNFPAAHRHHAAPVGVSEAGKFGFRSAVASVPFQDDIFRRSQSSLSHSRKATKYPSVQMALVDERVARGRNLAKPSRILAYDLVQGPLVRWSSIADKSIPDPPTAVLVHGILGSRKNWGTFARRLAQAFPTWQFLSVDLRCHGDSVSISKRGPHTVASAALDVLKLVAQLRITPRVLVGHSFGGKVVLSMVEQAAKPLARPVRVWVLDATPGKGHPGGDGEDHPEELISVLSKMPNEISQPSCGATTSTTEAFFGDLLPPVFSKRDVMNALIKEGFSKDVAQCVVTNLQQTSSPGSSSPSFSWVFDLKGIAEMNIVEDVPWVVHVNFLKAERSLHRWALEDLQRIHAAEDLAADEKVVEWKCMFLKMLVIGCMLITQMVSSGFSPLPSKESKPNELPNFHSRSVSAFLKL